MRRRFVLSVVFGLIFSTALGLTSALFTHLSPYVDKPMMPRPFFLAALAPGYFAIESIHFQLPWMKSIVFLGANALAYSVGFFLMSLIGFGHNDTKGCERRA